MSGQHKTQQVNLTATQQRLFHPGSNPGGKEVKRGLMKTAGGKSFVTLREKMADVFSEIPLLISSAMISRPGEKNSHWTARHPSCLVLHSPALPAHLLHSCIASTGAALTAPLLPGANPSLAARTHTFLLRVLFVCFQGSPCL